jgi:hypothetical protein
MVRVRRALAPEDFVTPATPTGYLARVTVDQGWKDSEAAPYAPPVWFTREGVDWIEPVPLTDYGHLEVDPLRPDATVWLYARHVGLVQRDFQRITTRSGTIPGWLPTAIRFEPTEPLGDRVLEVDVRDLQSVYSDDRLEDGDLLLVEVRAPGQDSERYLFRAFDFGWRTRVGAGVLLRVPLPYLNERDTVLSPALTLSAALGYRPRSEHLGLWFIGEQFGLIGSIGIGSTVLEQKGLSNQINSAFNALLVGGGLDVFKMFSVQILGNASAPFRAHPADEAGFALAIGFDAVQFARFADNLGARLLREYPMAEERAETDR